MHRQIVELSPEATHDLRRSVLRFDTPTKDVEFPEDTWPGTVHLGLLVDDVVRAVSSWVPRANPDIGIDAGIQLRGMATDRALQGRGLGGILVEGGCARFAPTTVWARARDAALGFYVAHGFVVVGGGFVDAATQLPHHLIVRRSD